MELVCRILASLNAAASAAGGVLLAPTAWLPDWASSTLIAAATGVVMLVSFKYTSNQTAVKRTRNQIKANLLALSLFKDNLLVSLRAQGRILANAVRLLLLAVVPILVMLVPMVLVLGQIALWYQARPLHLGEEAVVVLKLADADGAPPAVVLEPDPAVDVVAGPVRIQSRREVCWNVVPRRPGYHQLNFEVDGRKYQKKLAAGDGYMRVSLKRPDLSFADLLLHPWETPFSGADAVRSVEIQYPDRLAWTSGTRSWLYYWFAASMASALLFRKQLNVNL